MARSYFERTARVRRSGVATARSSRREINRSAGTTVCGFPGMTVRSRGRQSG